MARIWLGLAGAAILGAAGAWVLSAPRTIPEAELAGVTGDVTRGQVLFAAAGCASCHIAPETQAGDAPVLSGGQRFETAFGTFVAPNISPAPQGIGDWSDAELINAAVRGVGREGEHLYPAFPYTSYGRATVQDMADIVAYLRTLPPDATESQPHELGFPFNIRRSLGLWKLVFTSTDWVIAEAATPEIERGRYLVEALGHCGECHTPRNLVGGAVTSRWLGGAPNPDGEGRIPNITPGTLGWSAGEIAYYLETGFTPEFDSAGGSMAHVVRNTARLAPEDRAAIAAYLKAVPAVAPETP